MSTAAAVEADQLVKTYKPDVRALNGLSFSVEAGAVFGLLGPNGAGKSTAVKVLTTLARPDSGGARVAGLDVLSDAAKVRHLIGVVAQRSGVDRELTGRENLTLQAQIFGMGKAAARPRIGELLDQFGLTDAADRVSRGYSGGMQRRLDIATALVHRPQVLFLDEPTTGLDPEVRAGMWDEIARLAKDDGITVLLTTHYLEEADNLAASLAIVDRGTVVASGTPEQLKGELHGDAIHAELAESATEDAVAAALVPVAGVQEVKSDGRRVRARVAHGATAVPAVLAALEAGGMTVASVTVSRPSLDDVYLRHTGRAYADADAEGEAAA